MKRFVTILLLLCVLVAMVGSVQAVESRSGHWPAVRASFLKEHPTCSACGTTVNLTVHHVIPFHIDPTKELDPSNLITLCERCHLVFGHLGDYRSWNPTVREDAAAYLAKVKARPPRPIKLLPPAIRRPVGAAVRILVA